MYEFNSRADCKQIGFTIIELIAVIVILGILSSIAVQKFITFRTEANIVALQSMGAAILSNAKLIYAKSVINSIQNQAKTNIDIDQDGINDVEVVYGYPSGHRSNGIPKIMSGDFSTAWTWSANASNTIFWLTTATLGRRSGLYVNNTAVQASNCYILYYQATSSALPRISYVFTGC